MVSVEPKVNWAAESSQFGIQLRFWLTRNAALFLQLHDLDQTDRGDIDGHLALVTSVKSIPGSPAKPWALLQIPDQAMGVGHSIGHQISSRGNELYVRLDGVNKKLRGTEVTDYILRWQASAHDADRVDGEQR